MKNLSKVANDILERVEVETGKSIQFLRDDKLSVLATLQMARNGAEFHVLRYKPSNDPLDYVVAFQAGFVLRLFENKKSKRFDFSPAPDALRAQDCAGCRAWALHTPAREHGACMGRCQRRLGA